MLAASKAGAKIFRNNTGQGWVGQSKRLSDGSVLILNPRPLYAGLCIGSSDLIGWTSRVITPDMLGERVAIFTAVEVKSGTRPSAEQLKFIEAVRIAGGIAGIARTPQEVHNLITQINLI
jgi:hypothetical protein